MITHACSGILLEGCHWIGERKKEEGVRDPRLSPSPLLNMGGGGGEGLSETIQRSSDGAREDFTQRSAGHRAPVVR